MEPTLLAGDIIAVSKLTYGARIINLIKLIRRGEIDFYRLPGLSTIQVGDIFVFNSHKINYFNEAVYDNYSHIAVKRCFTTPGHFTIIKKSNKTNNISASNESDLFPRCFVNTWSSYAYGPLYVPAHDDSIKLTNVNIQIYKHIILSEDPNNQINDSIRSNLTPYYKFKRDYFFVLGDNFSNSIDSRYWGFVSEKDIIGEVVVVLCSFDNSKKGFRKIRFNRILKSDFE
jgi:signal peptidase I